ncbi:MAG: hypothetical protein IJC45_00870, partial [Clostridia bacterium]|nr:hypothetical protein [Clostridia bacterium]
MKKLLSFLLCLACVSSAAMLMSCQGDTPDETIDESKDPAIDQPEKEQTKDVEVALFSGDSEIRLIPTNNSLKVTYLATKASGKSLVAENSEYALPKQTDGTTASSKAVKFNWNYVDREDVSLTESGVEITGYKFIYEDSTGIAGLEVLCLASESLNGPFEFRMNLINKSTEDGLYIMPDSFSSISFDSLNDDASVMAIKKEGYLAEGYLHRNGHINEGTGIELYDITSDLNVVTSFTSSIHYTENFYLPMIYVTNGSDNGFYTAFEWTTGRILATSNDGERLTLSVDMDEVSEHGGEFLTIVPAGDTFVFPPVYYGVYDGSLDDGSNTFKKWFFDCKATATLRDNPNEPLIQNDHQWIIAEAEERGLESVKWDYGWWARLNNYDVNWGKLEGSWELRNPEHIHMINREGCTTMPEFGQYLNDKGIHWTVYVLLHDTVDYDMMSSDQYGEFNSIDHPDWFGYQRISQQGRSADLGNEECVEYLKTALTDFFN